MVELPNTSNIAKTFPDKFSLACNACWGQKADGYMILDTTVEEPVENNTLEEPEAKKQKSATDIPQPAAPVEPEKETQAETTTVDDNTLEEPEAKRQKLDTDITQPAAPVGPEKETQAETTAVDDDTLEEPEAKRQKHDTDIPQPAAPVEPEKETQADTWSTNGDGDWGTAAEGWGQEVVDEDSAWGSLGLDKPESLLSLLGPTALPLTHLPGIVERSMRRIVSITRPPSTVAKSPPLPDGVFEPNADAVELELDRHFAKVVLTPMIDWDGGESPVYTKPCILATSRGAVVGDNDTAASPTPGSPQPHNPASDEITVLIEDIGGQIDYLRVGMAIGGTWVQLVRQGESVVAKKKKKGKSKKSSYWYLDELALIVPSFWTIDDQKCFLSFFLLPHSFGN